MRERTNVKDPYIDDDAVPRCIRKAGGLDNYIKILEARKLARRKPKVNCECGITLSVGWFEKHKLSAVHAYRMAIKSKNAEL